MSLKIPSHLKLVATLPCEMLMLLHIGALFLNSSETWCIMAGSNCCGRSKLQIYNDRFHWFDSGIY